MNVSNVVFLATVLTAALASQAGTEVKFANQTINTTNSQFLFSQPLSQQMPAGEYVVQFKNTITESDKLALKEIGLKIYRYLPDDAFIVGTSGFNLADLSAKADLQSVFPYKGNFKLSTSFSSFSVFSQQQRKTILVTAFESAAVPGLLQKITERDSDVKVLEMLDRSLAVRVKVSVIPFLSELSGIEFVEPLSPMVPMHIKLLADEEPVEEVFNGDYTDLSGYETGTKIIRSDVLWSQGFYGADQIVAMADTGLDSGDAKKIHPDFEGSVKNGFSFGAGAKSWEDPMGHGTHVAGSVMGRGTASGGKLMGSAPKAFMVPQGMWSPIIDNLTVPPKLNRLFDAAYAEGARVHTNSWGSAQNFGAYDSMAQQVDEFTWNNPDFLVLFAAGNSGVDKDKNGIIDEGSVSSPGTSKNALTVGASENFLSVGGIQRKIGELKVAKDNWPAEPIFSSKLSDNAAGIAMFSSRGPTRDGRTKPEIVAPGTNILSVKSSLLKPEDNFWGGYSKDYIYSGGTSMATPLAAGAAAQTREVLISRFKISNPSAALVKAAMLHTAVDLYPGQYGLGPTQELKTQRPDSNQGYGRVDLEKLSLLSDSTTRFVDSAGLAQGETFVANIDVPAGKSLLLVNLVYTDAPGAVAAAAALVNNLDLKVNEKESASKINNHEMVELKFPAAGTYKIEVRGTNIPMGKNGKQPFSLIYTVL